MLFLIRGLLETIPCMCITFKLFDIITSDRNNVESIDIRLDKALGKSTRSRLTQDLGVAVLLLWAELNGAARCPGLPRRYIHREKHLAMSGPS